MEKGKKKKKKRLKSELTGEHLKASRVISRTYCQFQRKKMLKTSSKATTQPCADTYRYVNAMSADNFVVLYK